MNKLVEEVIKPILEANDNIKKIVGVYGGRFQPFGPHHYATYKWLTEQVDDAYITTSNIKKPPRHPMNFKEKVRHMVKMGVPKDKIFVEKIPYVAENVLKKYDKDTTAVVYIFGAKDAGRLVGGKKKSGGLAYYQDYKKNKNNLEGHENHGYILTTPHVSISVGGKEVSGTSMRELLGSPNIDDGDRQKLFKKMFGYFDKGVFQMMTNKFKKLFKEDIATGYPDKEDMKKIQKRLDKTRKQSESDKEYQYKPVDEIVKLPISIGDTVFMGKFKNKKVVIKSIDWNEKGDLLINGRPAMKFRLSQNEQIEEFLIATDIQKLLKESTSTLQGQVDDGPGTFYSSAKNYRKHSKTRALELGYEVIGYIMKDEFMFHTLQKPYPDGPINSVTYFPAGVGTGRTPDHQEEYTGTVAWNKWANHINRIASIVGWKFIDFLEDDKVYIVHDDKETQKASKEEEPEEVKESFSKDWWRKHLQEDLLKDIEYSDNPLDTRILLQCGGGYGHMNHPFDDKDLTFGDLKKIIELGLGGQLNREDNVTEKLDGQNLMISWKNDKLIVARNKGHMKNFGENALGVSGIKSKFEGRGDISDAFGFAVVDLQKAIKGLSQKQKDKIFNEGQHWMNLEVMWPASANVIDYDVTQIVFHGALKYNEKGEVIGEVKGSGKILAGMIKQINQHIQKKYSIGKPNFLDVPKHQDFGKMKKKYLTRLNKLKNEFGLKDSDTLSMYHQSFWTEFIYNAAKQFKYDMPKKVLIGLTKRWAFFDKSYKIPTIKKDVDNEKFLEWVLATDKLDHKKYVQQNTKPFEVLFFEVGSEILKNVKGYIAANPDKAVQGIKKRLDKAIKDVRAGKDLKKLNTLKIQLDKLDAIGGLKAIVPSEGIVFKYKGGTYKFTGSFGPVNQIAGLMDF